MVVTDDAQAASAAERPRWGPGLHVSADETVDLAAYDNYLGRWSALFVPALMAAAMIVPGDRALDVAAGPGEAMLFASSAAAPGGTVVGCDLSLPMLAAARARMPTAAGRLVVADGQALPFAARHFDAVLCQLGLMFFPDPGAGLREFRRVLRPGGRAAVCVLAAPDRVPVWGALASALGAALPRDRDLLMLSFALADATALRALFEAAGFADIRVVTERRVAVFASIGDYWRAVENAAGMLPQAYRGLPEPARRQVRADAGDLLAAFQAGGQLRLPIEVVIGAGRAAG